MKKAILLLVTLCSFAVVYGQGINFESGSYKDVLVKAKEQGKLLFISMSINGCSPCRLMEARVYPLQEVGDVYNKLFVCWKVNCSEDRTAEKLAADNDIRIFPAYVWIDPATGKIVHESYGSKRPEFFIEMAKVPFDKEKASGYFKEQYKAGNRDFGMLGKLYAYYTFEKQESKLLEIEADLIRQFGGDFTHKPFADFYFDHIVLRKSPMSQYLLEHKKKVMKLCGKERVLKKIAELR